MIPDAVDGISIVRPTKYFAAQPEDAEMADVKQAVAAAKQFAVDALGVNDLLLEEIGSEDDHFDVTLSFPKRANADTLSRLAPYREREFKTFSVDKSSGEVLGMTIRQL